MSFKNTSVCAATPATARGVSTKLSANNNKIIYTNGKTVIVSARTLLTLWSWYPGACRFVTWMSVMHSSRLYILRCWLALQNPSAAVTYSGHVHNATVARISPSGYYCASADASGTGRFTRYFSSWLIAYMYVLPFQSPCLGYCWARTNTQRRI